MEMDPATPFLDYSKKGLGFLRVRSPLLTQSQLISIPPGTKMFQFPGLYQYDYEFIVLYPDSHQDGFPHSESHGSKVLCTSPWIIAA